MVRVIPVHNFLEQNVAQIEEPSATCTISNSNGEFLLIALPSHCVEVHDLTSPDLKLITSFPTVDLAIQLLYCSKGNYVVTLESKQSRDNVQSSNFIRVYVNWNTQERQPMRARIAGRVTPSLNRPQNNLEMIELPLNVKPTMVACCQTTGNLLVAANNTLILHEFKIETQATSKLKFIDFEARPWSLGLHFSPTRLEIVEDFISVMDSSRFVVFRLTNPLYDDIDHLSSLTSTTSSLNDKTDNHSADNMDNSFLLTPSNDINLTKQINNTNKTKNVDNNSNLCSFLNSSKNKRKKEKYIDWNTLVADEKMELQYMVNEGVIDSSCQLFTMNLPSISLERAGPGHTLNPFILNTSDTEVIIKTNSPDNGWSENYAVKNILRLKIARANDFPHVDENTELFTNFVIRPIYLKTNSNSNGLKKSIFRSEKYKYLNGVACFICTSQDGYIYHFGVENNDNNPTCLTTYTFTAPVIHVALEYTVLHALTESGLESYTLRLPHHIAKTASQLQNMTTIYPDISEPVCLIGLRSFMGIQKLLVSDKCIVLLAKAENSWTLYSLRLPKPENVYYDIINAAKNHKTTSAATYRHLLEEAHAILRLEKDVIDFSVTEKENYELKNDLKLENLYNQSCALLGDYFIRSANKLEQNFCIPYYKMSGLKPSEVLLRKSTHNAPGLVTYLCDILKTAKSGPEADALFQSQDVVNILSYECREDLLKIIFESVVLREYATDKLINLLVAQSEDDYSQLALTLLYIQAEKKVMAETALDHVSDRFLLCTVLDYPHLLFDEDNFDLCNQTVLSFSEFSAILICRKCQVFAQILTKLIQNGIFNLHQVMQVFIEYLPSRVGRDGHDAAFALQQFLEVYLKNYFSKLEDKNELNYNFALTEAFKILVRSYLGKLVKSKVTKSNDDLSNKDWEDDDVYLFESQRPKYLDKMPPCAKDYHKIINAVDLDEFTKLNNSESEKIVQIEVLKLQALMASDFLPVESLQEVEQFVNSEEVEGALAFRTLFNRNIDMITEMLVEKCPQAVLQYAKDMYTKETEWKLLVNLLQQKISSDNSNQETRLYFEQIMIDTLKYAAEILSLKSLHYILPKDNEESFQHYTEICGQIVHAEHVKSLLMETGRQLLSSLNL